MSIRGTFRGRWAFMLGVAAVLATSGGLNLAVFALVNALWLRPVPVKGADRVFVVSSTRGSFATPVFSTFARVAGQVAGTQNAEPVFHLLNHPRQPEILGVTADYFRLFGLEIRGRDFAEDDDRAGAEPVAIVSDRLWSEVFDRRSDIVGTVVPGDPVSVRIIGVAPPGFEGARRGERTDVWVSRATFPRMLRLQPGGTLGLTVWVRLAPGDTAAAAEERLNEKALISNTLLPVSDVYGAPGTRTTLLRDGGATRVVAALASLVMLGGCAALASLLLVHFERRRLEFGIRAALGASPGRLMRSVVGELVVVGVVGTLGALVVATLALRGIGVLRLQLPAGVDLARLDLSFGWPVVLAGLALTTLTLALAASLPLARLLHRRLVRDLLGGPATTASVTSQRVRQGLLATLVCATAIVLVSATLFVRSVHRAYTASPGFDVERLLFASVPVTPFRLGSFDLEKSFALREERVRMVREALRAIPGVERVAISGPPISESRESQVQNIRTFKTRERVHQLRAPMMLATPDVLAALGVPIVLGRDLTPADIDTSPTPMVMTESMARTLWPVETPLGQTFGDGNYVVVGVARDFAFGSLAGRADGVTVIPTDGHSDTFTLRTSRPDAALIGEVRRVLGEVLTDTATATVVTGREVIERDLGRQRLGAWFFSAFGLVALGVGVGSVFGMVAYLAESRRREFGVRLALGASPGDLVWHGMAAALLPVGIGLAAGLAAAAAVSRVFDSLLVGVTRLDAVTYVAVAVVLLAAAAGAALLAAWRLRGVAPVEALRTS